jgi:hypothetical protein
MSLLKDNIAPLESDLKAVPARISVYHDLPFAIMRYDPTGDQAGNCRQRGSHRPDVRTTLVGGTLVLLGLNVASLFLQFDEGRQTFVIVLLMNLLQQQATTYLSSKVWIPLWDLLAERLASISPENSVVFLTRVAAT